GAGGGGGGGAGGGGGGGAGAGRPPATPCDRGDDGEDDQRAERGGRTVHAASDEQPTCRTARRARSRGCAVAVGRVRQPAIARRRDAANSTSRLVQRTRTGDDAAWAT